MSLYSWCETIKIPYTQCTHIYFSEDQIDTPYGVRIFHINTYNSVLLKFKIRYISIYMVCCARIDSIELAPLLIIHHRWRSCHRFCSNMIMQRIYQRRNGCVAFVLTNISIISIIYVLVPTTYNGRLSIYRSHIIQLFIYNSLQWYYILIHTLAAHEFHFAPYLCVSFPTICIIILFMRVLCDILCIRCSL